MIASNWKLLVCILVAMLCCVLPFATSAYAECAWVLWRAEYSAAELCHRLLAPGAGSWGGQRPSLGDYVKRGADAATGAGAAPNTVSVGYALRRRLP